MGDQPTTDSHAPVLAGGNVDYERFGEFELLEGIGAGGMAEIFKARLRRSGGFEKLLAVKRILPSYANNRAFVQMLSDEARVCSHLSHPNIVSIFDFGAIDGRFFLAMELIKGKDLLKILARCVKTEREIPIALTLHMVSEVAKGLHHAHFATDAAGRKLNIIHRDVSPSNILVSYDGAIKITDFGVAKARKQHHTSSSGATKGKLGYMSPEQVIGSEIDLRSDIFALGTILFETLTLKRLFIGKSDFRTLMNIRDARIDRRLQRHDYIPEAIVSILRRALARKPEERYQTALEMHEAIDEYMFENRLRVRDTDVGALLAELFPGEARSLTIEDHARAGGAALDVRPGAQDSSGERPSSKEALRVAAPSLAPKADEADKGGGESADSPAFTSRSSYRVVSRKLSSLTAPEPTGDFSHAAVSEGASTSGVHTVVHDLPATILRQLGTSSFVVRDALGNTFGPITFDNFIRLIRARAINEGEQVSVDGADWRSVRFVPGIREHIDRLFPKEHRTPQQAGSISRVQLPKLFFSLWSGRATGKLTIGFKTTRKEVYFQQGNACHITSTLKGELIGQFMVSRKLLSPEQLETAIQRACSTHTKIGEALVSLRYTTHHHFFEAFNDLHRRRFRQFFQWNSGSYEFYDQVRPPKDAIVFDLDMPAAIWEAVRESYGFEELKDVFKPHYHKEVLVSESGRKKVAIESLRFNAQELSFLAEIRQGGVMADLLRRHAQKKRDALTLFRVLFALLQMDMVTFKA